MTMSISDKCGDKIIIMLGDSFDVLPQDIPCLVKRGISGAEKNVSLIDFELDGDDVIRSRDQTVMCSLQDLDSLELEEYKDSFEYTLIRLLKAAYALGFVWVYLLIDGNSYSCLTLAHLPDVRIQSALCSVLNKIRVNGGQVYEAGSSRYKMFPSIRLRSVGKNVLDTDIEYQNSFPIKEMPSSKKLLICLSSKDADSLRALNYLGGDGILLLREQGGRPFSDVNTMWYKEGGLVEAVLSLSEKYDDVYVSLGGRRKLNAEERQVLAPLFKDVKYIISDRLPQDDLDGEPEIQSLNWVEVV